MQHVTQDTGSGRRQVGGRMGSGPARHLTLVSNPAPSQANEWRFNSRDLIALSCWMQGADRQGYSRVVIENGCSDDTTDDGEGLPEDASYALFYKPSSDWACWGVARSGADIVVWRCSTGADHGRYATIRDALANLPRATGPAPDTKARPATTVGPVVAGTSIPMKPRIDPPRLRLVHSRTVRSDRGMVI